jgi:hypothetical protein
MTSKVLSIQRVISTIDYNTDNFIINKDVQVARLRTYMGCGLKMSRGLVLMDG